MMMTINDPLHLQVIILLFQNLAIVLEVRKVAAAERVHTLIQARDPGLVMEAKVAEVKVGAGAGAEVAVVVVEAKEREVEVVRAASRLHLQKHPRHQRKANDPHVLPPHDHRHPATSVTAVVDIDVVAVEEDMNLQQ
jgi:hypothetical protein